MRLRTFLFFCALAVCASAFAQSLPAGFQRSDPIAGRALPVGVSFAHDGRVFVPEKSGRIWVYQNLLDTNPQLFADLTENVHDNWDRGLLGFTLDPRFPEVPYVYVLYAYNGGLFPETHRPRLIQKLLQPGRFRIEERLQRRHALVLLARRPRPM